MALWIGLHDSRREAVLPVKADDSWRFLSDRIGRVHQPLLVPTL